MCLTFWILFLLFNSTLSTVIKCNFNHPLHRITSKVYQCYVINELNLNSGESATITNVTGHHQNSMTHNNVTSFYAHNKNIQIFPFRLEKLFKNLQELTIRNSSLRILSKNNLMPLHNLTHLCLSENLIEEIPMGFFTYNHHLKSIILSNNRIFHMSSNVFDHLTKLVTLRLSNNFCIDESADDDNQEVQEIIKVVKTQCSYKDLKDMGESIHKSIDILKQTSKIIFTISKRNLNKNTKDVTFQTFTGKIDDIEDQFSSLQSMVSNFS